MWRENREVITRDDLEASDKLEWYFLDDDELFETNLVLELTSKRFRELSQRPSGRFDTWEDTIPQYGHLPPEAECLKTTGRRKSDKKRYYLVIRRGNQTISFKEVAKKEETLEFSLRFVTGTDCAAQMHARVPVIGGFGGHN